MLSRLSGRFKLELESRTMTIFFQFRVSSLSMDQYFFFFNFANQVVYTNLSTKDRNTKLFKKQMLDRLSLSLLMQFHSYTECRLCIVMLSHKISLSSIKTNRYLLRKSQYAMKIIKDCLN